MFKYILTQNYKLYMRKLIIKDIEAKLNNVFFV